MFSRKLKIVLFLNIAKNWRKNFDKGKLLLLDL